GGSSRRRTNPAVPEESLLLQKPLGLARHEGGKLLAVGSREYQVLLDWLRASAPGPRAAEPKLEKLSLTTRAGSQKPGDTQALKVEAHFSDGSRSDVTWLTRFDSNDAAVVTVSSDGTATIRGHGETALRASFQSEVATAIVSVPFAQTVASERFKVSGTPIDEHVYRKLAALNIEPSDRCDDTTFIRRAFLDTIGTLPAPGEVRSFLSDNDAGKRAKLIDDLLTRPEWVDYWTLQLCDLLQNRKERDHDVRGAKGVRTFHEWVRRQLAANRPWNELARDILTASGPSTTNPAVGYYVVTVGEHREADRSEVVASVAQAFLGTRIGCAQCHNHPLERYTQDDYYHFAAYFSRIRFDRKESKDGPTTLRVSHPEPNQNRMPV